MRPRIVLLVVVAAAFVWSQWQAVSDHQRVEREVEANCTVIGVLLDARANRDATVKLFEPIRRRDPELWDRLVERAERGDAKLLASSRDLSCDIPKRVLRKLSG